MSDLADGPDILQYAFAAEIYRQESVLDHEPQWEMSSDRHWNTSTMWYLET